MLQLQTSRNEFRPEMKTHVNGLQYMSCVIIRYPRVHSNTHYKYTDLRKKKLKDEVF